MAQWLDRKDNIILDALEKDHSDNHGVEITTEGILKGIENLERMPEMVKFDNLIKEMIENGEGGPK